MTVLQPSQLTMMPVYPSMLPRTPRVFLGGVHEDIDNWIEYLDCVAQFNNWSDKHMLDNMYSLEDTAHSGSKTMKPPLRSGPCFNERPKKAFVSNLSRERRAEDTLRARIPNETATSFIEDVLRLL